MWKAYWFVGCLLLMPPFAPNNMIVTSDKSSIAERSLMQEFTRSAKGTRTKRIPWGCDGKRYSLLPAIFTGRVLAMACQEGSIKWNDFDFYLEHQLVSLFPPDLVAQFLYTSVLTPGGLSYPWWTHILIRTQSQSWTTARFTMVAG